MEKQQLDIPAKTLILMGYKKVSEYLLEKMKTVLSNDPEDVQPFNGKEYPLKELIKEIERNTKFGQLYVHGYVKTLSYLS